MTRVARAGYRAQYLAMTPMSHGRVAGLAVVISVVLVGGGAALLSSPARAQSAELTYACTINNAGSYDVSVTWDTDAPDSFVEGTSVDNVTTTAQVTVDPDAVAFLRSLSATRVGGSAAAPMTINGANWDRALTITSGNVPPVDVPMVVTATQAGGILPSGPIGQLVISVGTSFSASLTAFNVNTPVGPVFNLACALSPDTQVRTVDVTDVLEEPGPTAPTSPTGPTGPTEPTSTLTSTNTTTATATATTTATQLPAPAVKEGTATTAKAVYRAARDRLVAKAKVVADQGSAVTGSVKLVLKRNGVKIRTATVEVNDAGKVKKAFKSISKPGKYVVVARYLGSAALERSKGTDKVVV